MKKSALSAALGLFLLGCHTITEELPTKPSQTTTASAASPTIAIQLPVFQLPGATATPTPAPKPTPTPSPGPTPTPDATPSPGPSGSCSNPTPGPITKVDVKVHIVGANRLILDSTPMVGPDAEYCRKIGFTDGRRYCPTRAEGSDQRYACDVLTVGQANDTGRTGPTWTFNGGPCVIEKGCENHEDNQFLVSAYKKGVYEACVQSGACGSWTYQ
jgi:hypothetical protein